MESTRTLIQGAGGTRAPAPARRAARILAGEEPGWEERDGTLVLGRYVLLERLGAGGFGEVWRARDELLHREVALKRVGLGPDDDGDRAEREALAAARLSHPAIVALYEACATADAFYLISELVDGVTLAELIRTDELDDAEIIEIGVALAAALEHAHARGVIHRDIKPQNVLVPNHVEDAAGAAKLTDFGGAQLTGEEALTRTGDVLGTLAYMAPEQSEGREIGEEADLYSLALVLYEALAGANPVRGPTPAATARRIGRRVEPLQRSRRDLPRELTRAIDLALAADPRERGALEDLRSALVRTLGGLPEPERPPRRPSRPPPRQPASTRRAPVLSPRALPAAVPVQPRPATEPGASSAQPGPSAPPAPGQPSAGPRLALPRAVWAGCALALIGWQAVAGRPGVALLAAAALLPLLALPRRAGPVWLTAALAPALGVVGLAGAFPAVAGQLRRWAGRAALGALGYWWLTLAEPLLGRRLWLGPQGRLPAREQWESSLGSGAVHVVGPLLSSGVLLGALLWALAAAVLPWLVRGTGAALDIVAATVWSAALLTAAPMLDAGLASHATQPAPRGAVLGAVLAGAVAVAARALRGPVRSHRA